MASSAWTSCVSGLRCLETIVRTCAANTHTFATRAAAERMSIAQGLWALRWANIESCMKCGNVSATPDHSVSVYARYWIHVPRPNFMSAGIVHEAAVLAANIALFAYWRYKIVVYKRNPITGVLYCELAEFRTIVREHCDDKDKYFLVDRIPETPEELGFEPDSPTPPAGGYRAWMPWWRGEDKRHPSKRGAGLRS